MLFHTTAAPLLNLRIEIETKLILRLHRLFQLNTTLSSAVARPNRQPRQAGVARGVRGHAPPPPEKF